MNIPVLMNACCSSRRSSDNIKQHGWRDSYTGLCHRLFLSSDYMIFTAAAHFGELDTGDPHWKSWCASGNMCQRTLKKVLQQLVGWCKVHMNHLKAASYFSAGVNREYLNGLRCLKWYTLISICLAEWSHRPNAFSPGEKGGRKGNSTCSKWM